MVLQAREGATVDLDARAGCLPPTAQHAVHVFMQPWQAWGQIINTA